MNKEQLKIIEDFSELLYQAGRTKDDKRADVLKLVAEHLSKRDQFFTAQLVRHMVALYEGT